MLNGVRSDMFVVHLNHQKIPFHFEYLFNSTTASDKNLVLSPVNTLVKIYPNVIAPEIEMKHIVIRKAGEPDPDAPTKTFLEKYWHLGLLFLVIALIPTGDQAAPKT
jgi:hypothetical protein